MADLTTCEDMPVKGSIGIASWGSSDAALYYTDSSQRIRERTYHNATWNGGTTSDIIVSGKNTTPLAVMQWFWDMNGTIPTNSIRVYYLDNNYKMHEICWNGPIDSWPQATPPANWFDGELNLNSCTTARNSKLACVHWGAFLRLYYQGTDGNLRQHCRDYQNAWYAGLALPLPSGTRPYSGTALAAVSRNPSSAEISLFFQGNDGHVYQAKYNGSWTVSGQLFAARKGTSLAVVLKPDENAIRVYAADPDGKLAQYTGDPNSFTKQLYPSKATILEGSSLAAQVVKVNDKYKVKVFFIESTTATSVSAAMATSQGRAVLSGGDVPRFLNVSYDHWEDDSDGGEAALAEFD